MNDQKINVNKTIENMATDLDELIEERNLEQPILIGIRTGGVWVANKLHKLLEIEDDLSILDINFYRDDFSRVGLSPRIKPSVINSDLDDRDIILVDDVLHTGRTICAALNEIADYGRSATVTLATLIDRGNRELPIEADVCGVEITLDESQQIKLRGPDPLSIEIFDIEYAD